MGGCASKPNESDDRRPTPIPEDDNTSSLEKPNVMAAAAPASKEEGEKQEIDNKQNESPLVDLLSEPKQAENHNNATSEQKSNVSNDSDVVITQPKTQHNAANVDSDVVIVQPKTQDKVENVVGGGGVIAKESESKQSVDALTKLEDKAAPLISV